MSDNIAAVEAYYMPLIVGTNPRVEGAGKLWGQFTAAAAAYRERGKAAYPAVIERVNELVVAGILLADRSLADRRILYEPHVAADDRRIDFVVPEAEGESLYIEVKTVRPTAKDTEENWSKYEQRRDLHTPNVEYIVRKESLGAEIDGNYFAARSKFMDYSRDFESRLAAASAVQPGRGVLIFCGTGWEWNREALEDFADFYRTGKHRQDDGFATMEAYALSKESIELQRNIAAFGFVKRPTHSITEEEWVADVRGPPVFR